MKYPLPKHKEYFVYATNTNTTIPKKKSDIPQSISREKPNPLLQEYTNFINKRSILYTSLPFVTNIYLCNSLTFNALHEKSDIDLTIITHPWRLWIARFRSLFLFSILRIKRSSSHMHKRFCLSFYIDQQHQNLYNIKGSWDDIYLCYRLAHLVPLYAQDSSTKDQLIQANKNRLQQYLPRHPMVNTININTKFFTASNRFKKSIEFFHQWRLWDFIEKLLQVCRTPILLYKKSKLGQQAKHIIIAKHMLKFHSCIRQKIQYLYEIATSKHQTTSNKPMSLFQ